MISRIFCHQSKYSAARPSHFLLWYDASNRCLCVQFSMSSPSHHFSYRRLSVLICLQAPVSLFSCFCTSFSAVPFRIASLKLLLNVEILISYFPCLAARVFPREDCSICPLAPLFVYLEIWYSLIRQNVGSLIHWFSSMRFQFDQERCCPCCSFSSVRLFSSWMTVMSSCSRSNHRFGKKIQLLLAIVHPLCGFMHVVRPSVVLILVLPRRSSQSSNSARILTYPPLSEWGVGGENVA